MNEAQFNIVKIMQAIGISANRFANACNEKPAKFERVYRCASFSQLVELIQGDEMMDQMGVPH